MNIELPHPLSNTFNPKGEPMGQKLVDLAKDPATKTLILWGEPGATKSTTAALLSELSGRRIVPVMYEHAMGHMEEYLKRHPDYQHESEPWRRKNWGRDQYNRMTTYFSSMVKRKDRKRLEDPQALLVVETISTPGIDGLNRATTFLGENAAIQRAGLDEGEDRGIRLIGMVADPLIQWSTGIIRREVGGTPEIEAVKAKDIFDYFLNRKPPVEIIGVEHNLRGGNAVKKIIARQATAERMQAMSNQVKERAKRWWMDKWERDQLVRSVVLPRDYESNAIIFPERWTGQKNPISATAFEYRMKAAFTEFIHRNLMGLPEDMAATVLNPFNIEKTIRWDITHFLTTP